MLGDNLKVTSFMTSAEKDQHKKAMQALAGIFGGPLLAAIGFGTHIWLLGILGVLGFVAGIFTVYKTVKQRQEVKRIKAEEAEIRAYQLRKARGEVA
jgi:hypothetical protein